VEVRDGLSRRSADIHAEIPAVGAVSPLDGGTDHISGGDYRDPLSVRGVKPALYVPPRDDESVTGRNREPIPEGTYECVRVKAVGVRACAEWAARRLLLVVRGVAHDCSPTRSTTR
jgi:hypothetical protein